MLTHHHDHTFSLQSSCAPVLQRANQSYYAEVPALALDEQSWLVEQLIDVAFGTLGAHHLDVRVLAAAPDQARQPSALGVPFTQSPSSASDAAQATLKRLNLNYVARELERASAKGASHMRTVTLSRVPLFTNRMSQRPL